MPKCIFVIGIPCSGKSTWAQKQDIPILSRDDIRLEINGPKYQFKPETESQVTIRFKKLAEMLHRNNQDVIIDNTNLRKKYVEDIKKMFPGYKFEYKFFPIPLWKANVRNILRWIKTGKWIPFKVMKDMYKQYKKLSYEYMVL